MQKTGQEIAELYGLGELVEFVPENFTVGSHGVTGKGYMLRVERWYPAREGDVPVMAAECSLWLEWKPEDVVAVGGVFPISPKPQTCTPSKLQDTDNRIWPWPPPAKEKTEEAKPALDLSGLLPAHEEPLTPDETEAFEEALQNDPESDLPTDHTNPAAPNGWVPVDVPPEFLADDDEQEPPADSETIPDNVLWSGPHKTKQGAGGKLYQLVHTEPSQQMLLSILEERAHLTGSLKLKESTSKLLELVKQLRKDGYDIDIANQDSPDAIVHIGPLKEPQRTAEVMVPVGSNKTLAQTTAEFRSALKDYLCIRGIEVWSLRYWLGDDMTGRIDCAEETE